MGRPKLSDLKCKICNVKFERKSLLDEHMETHLGSSNQNRQLRKHLKDYCYICRKSFDHLTFKLHIETEHPFDLPKMNNNDAKDLFSYENGFVLLSKRKIKKENHSPKKSTAVEKNKSFDASIPDIKIEPVDELSEESDWAEHQKTETKKSIQKNVLKEPKLECSICGVKCKSKKGLKIHMCAHKRSRANSNSDTPQCENNQEYKFGHSSKINVNASFSNSSNIPILISNNSFTQNAQSNYILNPSHFHNQSNNLACIGNDPNSILQFGNPINLMNPTIQPYAQSVPIQNTQPSDDIPKFDCDSEKYMKWLKNFVSECRKHDFPLNPELCKKISFVTEELTCALGNPEAPLKHKPNHFHLMSMFNILSDIKLKHLQSRLCGKKK